MGTHIASPETAITTNRMNLIMDRNKTKGMQIEK